MGRMFLRYSSMNQTPEKSGAALTARGFVGFDCGAFCANSKSGAASPGLAATGAYIQSLSGKGSPLPKDALHFFGKRMDYDFSSVKIHTNTEAEQSALEFLQYALLCGVTGEELSPSPAADAFWHDFLMDTRTYSEWCEKHFGYFLHHRPESIDSLRTRGVIERSRRLFQAFFITPHNGNIATCHGTNCGNSTSG